MQIVEFKFRSTDAVFSIRISKGAILLKGIIEELRHMPGFGFDQKVSLIHFLADPNEAELEHKSFQIFETYDTVPKHAEYVGSLVCSAERKIKHVFELRPEAN